MRILLVEDNEADAALLARDLHGFGADSRIVETLFDALTAIRRGFAPDLVICDIALPDATGAEAVRALDAASDVPILVVSGAEDAEIASAVQAGACGYVLKGLPAQHLCIAVEAARALRGRCASPRVRGNLSRRLDALTTRLRTGSNGIPVAR